LHTRPRRILAVRSTVLQRAQLLGEISRAVAASRRCVVRSPLLKSPGSGGCLPRWRENDLFMRPPSAGVLD
jgi:hypothetical protein